MRPVTIFGVESGTSLGNAQTDQKRKHTAPCVRHYFRVFVLMLFLQRITSLMARLASLLFDTCSTQVWPLCFMYTCFPWWEMFFSYFFLPVHTWLFYTRYVCMHVHMYSPAPWVQPMRPVDMLLLMSGIFCAQRCEVHRSLMLAKFEGSAVVEQKHFAGAFQVLNYTILLIKC